MNEMDPANDVFDKNLLELLDVRNSNQTKTALIWRDPSKESDLNLSYRDLFDDANKFAKNLKALGVLPKSNVAFTNFTSTAYCIPPIIIG